MVLLVNACARSESRTKRLADALMKKWDGPVREVRLLDTEMPRVDEAFLGRRDALLGKGEYDSPLFALAREFAAAGTIVIAAPFWDLYFPAILKQYFELINVPGITFVYTSDGTPRGLCKAKALYYVTTAGGTASPLDYGFGYVKALAENFYGIPEARLIKAEGLDIDGADVSRIMREAIASIRAMDT
ncbi:MAG: NAD(P)H-dependent oxidoreductase [Schwartzia sp.]|nr:NAD(P)H-dependent oxidoreductase [Schwartzia sp. (in: firmicutes)]